IIPILILRKNPKSSMENFLFSSSLLNFLVMLIIFIYIGNTEQYRSKIFDTIGISQLNKNASIFIVKNTDYKYENFKNYLNQDNISWNADNSTVKPFTIEAYTAFTIADFKLLCPEGSINTTSKTVIANKSPSCLIFKNDDIQMIGKASGQNNVTSHEQNLTQIQTNQTDATTIKN
ncbi:MAG: hypothetical protein ACK5LP_02600, partial [Campylobacteraceae bacterium]